MQKLISSSDDLYEYFMICARPDASKSVRAKVKSGVNVDTIVRREVMTNERQGKITIGGTVKQICFKSLGGGVYLATVGDL